MPEILTSFVYFCIFMNTQGLQPRFTTRFLSPEAVLFPQSNQTTTELNIWVSGGKVKVYQHKPWLTEVECLKTKEITAPYMVARQFLLHSPLKNKYLLHKTRKPL